MVYDIPADLIHETFNKSIQEIVMPLLKSSDPRDHDTIKLTLIYADLRSREKQMKDVTAYDVSITDIYEWVENIISKEKLVLGFILQYPSLSNIKSKDTTHCVKVINFLSVTRNRSFQEKKTFVVVENKMTPIFSQVQDDFEVDAFDSILNTKGNC